MSEKLSFLEKNTYGIPWIVHQLAAQSIMALIFPIFTIEFGVSAATVGLIIGLSRVYDAFTDPLMGNITDNFNSRFGKRRPFIFSGAIAMGVVFPLIFLVPAGSSPGMVSAWLAVSLVLFFTAYTVFIVPLLALGFELTTDIRERTAVQAYRAGWVAVASFIPPWLYRLAQSGSFSGPAEGGLTISLCVGVMMVVFGTVPIFFLREKAPKKVAGSDKMKFVPALLETMRNRQFMILMAFTIAFMMSVTMVYAFGTYQNIYYVFSGDKIAATTMLGLYGTVHAVVAFFSIPLTAWLARRMGKVRAISVNLSALLAGTLLQWVAFNPRWPFLQLVLIAPLMAFAASGFWVLVSSMRADVCDYDQLSTGRYRAGMYGAVSGWFQKLAEFGATTLAGVFIAATLIRPELGSAQSPEAVFKLRLFALAPGTVFSLVSLFLVRFYSLTEERMQEIQRILKSRGEGSN